MNRRTIGVYPTRAFVWRQRLFAALGALCDCEFVPVQSPRAELDGIVLFGTSADAATAPRRYVVASEAGTPERPLRRDPAEVQLANHRLLDRRLRGQALQDAYAGSVRPLRVPNHGHVLARRGEQALWWAYDVEDWREDRVALPPPELAAGDELTDHLWSGNWLRVLPLLHFARQVSGAWQAPPLRACFLFDDPNLHWSTYGFLRFRDFVAWAERAPVHVSVAQVPLDARFAAPWVVKLFLEHAGTLSICIHGNDHISHELTLTDSGLLRRMLAQALRRTAAMEKRTGLHVDRIMTAPHGVCSEQAARALLLLKVQGLAISRPFPWCDRTPADQPIAKALPAALVAGGLPVLPRTPLGRSTDEAVIKAFLDQPLIIYGHHDDLAGGFAPLEQWHRRIQSMGAVRWESLQTIAETNVSSRREGRALHLQLHTRRCRLQVPDGVNELRLHWQCAGDCEAAQSVRVRHAGGIDSATLGQTPARLVVRAGDAVISVRHPHAFDPQTVSAPPMRLWPMLRRFMTATRDRTMPLLRRRAG